MSKGSACGGEEGKRSEAGLVCKIWSCMFGSSGTLSTFRLRFWVFFRFVCFVKVRWVFLQFFRNFFRMGSVFFSFLGSASAWLVLWYVVVVEENVVIFITVLFANLL